MRVALPYGSRHVSLETNEQSAEWHLIKAPSREALKHPWNNFTDACHNPIASPPLGDIIKPTDRVVIVTCDGTRPFPNKIILPWLLDELKIPDDRITVLLGNGTHRKNTPAELDVMFGSEIVRRLRILNHECAEESGNRFIGTTKTNCRVSLNRHYVDADKRIVLGFIEPHFFAGFSGGAKGVIPAVAALGTIMHIHRSELIAHPDSTWGEIERNPIRQEIHEMVSMCPPDFLVNVSLNTDKQITGFFCGDYKKAHRSGCAEVGKSSIVTVKERYPLVVTTNGGYPLDQNLYQTVKGMSAAARIVEPGGTILVASECRDGIPGYGRFAKMMSQGSTPEEILHYIETLPEPAVDQWQVEILASLLRQAKIGLYSDLAPGDVRGCGLYPVDDLQSEIGAIIGRTEGKMKVAVLPEGPLTIPSDVK